VECNQGRRAKLHERESSSTGDTYGVAVMYRNTLDLISGERNHHMVDRGVQILFLQIAL